ncbi:MAG TPA: hypothetical protein VIU02_08225 [Burkholderiales bacterium]
MAVSLLAGSAAGLGGSAFASAGRCGSSFGAALVVPAACSVSAAPCVPAPELLRSVWFAQPARDALINNINSRLVPGRIAVLLIVPVAGFALLPIGQPVNNVIRGVCAIVSWLRRRHRGHLLAVCAKPENKPKDMR